MGLAWLGLAGVSCAQLPLPIALQAILFHACDLHGYAHFWLQSNGFVAFELFTFEMCSNIQKQAS